MRISDQIQTELVNAVRAAAQEEVVPRFRALSPAEVATKSSATDLVTVADKAAEARISAEISRLLPGALIVGEEAVAEDKTLLAQIEGSELSVIIDPIDGTWNYANNLPLFGVMVSVVAEGRTVFGLLYDPLSDAWISARDGAGAFRTIQGGGTTRLRVATDSRCAHGLVPLYLFPVEVRRRLAPRLLTFDRIGSYRCSCHEYWLLVEGGVDFAISGHLQPWDHAAGELIYREAGGVARMLEDGAPYSAARSTGHLLLARSPETWENLCELFSEAIFGP
ncbi:MAG: inositol monophosphatase [Pseudomonadota bacterium]